MSTCKSAAGVVALLMSSGACNSQLGCHGPRQSRTPSKRDADVGGVPANRN
jgi:hypothetical protein